MKSYYLSVSTQSRSDAPISFWIAYHDTYTKEFLWKGWDNSKTVFTPTELSHLPNSNIQSTFEISEQLATTLSSLTPIEVCLVIQQQFPECFV